MRKKSLLIFLILVSVFMSVFCACVNKDDTKEETTLVSIEVDEATVPADAIKGAVDITQIQLILHYSDDTHPRITINRSMLKEESLAKLNEVGTHQFTVVYQQKTTKFQMEIHDDSIPYYTLRVYGGVPTYVDGKKLINAIALPENGYYENTYPDGTVVTVQWINDGNNFSYWTANDLPVSSESITDVVVNGNLVYRPYSTPAVSTVSFKTFSSSVIQSKTTNRLFETDIPAVYRDNYIFAGWTTDVITEAQSIAGYSKHIVSFPFEVGRDITFYATWLPMGVVYEQVGEHYEVVGYEGNAFSLDIPEKFNGTDVTVIRANAFDGTHARTLRSVSISSAIKTIGKGAFKNCSHLSSIVTSGSGSYRAIDGVLYSSDGKELVAYPANRPAARYAVASGTETIDDYAFFDAIVGSIALPSSVGSVGYRAFDSVHIDNVDMSALSPTNLEPLPTKLFNDKLDKVVLASSSKELFISLFPVISAVSEKTVVSASDTHTICLYSYDEADGQNLSVLYRIVYDKNLVDESAVTNDRESYATAEIMGVGRTAVTFAIPIRLAQPGERPYIVTSLADYAFKGCTLLNNVVFSFSSRLERIGDDVFTDTPWLATIQNDTLSANNIVYKYLGSDAVYALDNSIVKIAEGAFRGNTSLKYVDIGENAALTTIGPSAFEDCSAFTGFICSANPQGEGLYFKYAVRSVGERAFRNTAVTSIKLQPSSLQQINCLTSIGSAAFENCYYLTSATLSRSTVNVADDAFVGCVSLQEFVLSEKNPVFEVYEGILYSYNAEKEYTLFAYPAGRVDGEFDPSYVRLYGHSLDCDLSEYSGRSVSVGTVVLNGEKEDVYLIVKSGIDYSIEYDVSSESYYLLATSGTRLLPSESATVRSDGTIVMSGDYCYFIKSEDGVEDVPLLYDSEKSAFYYYPVTRRPVQSISVDLSVYEESVDKNVGTVVIADKTFVVYLNVRDGIQIVKTSTDVVPKNKDTNERLRQTTSIVKNDDGTFTVNGEFYYYVYFDEDKTEKTVLLYDSVSGGYVFEEYLNVTSIGSNAFSYSSVAAVRISALIGTVGENAFNVPGLLYIRFDSNPAVFSYDSFFGEYEPEFVLLSDRLQVQDKTSFFDNNSDLMNEKATTDSYRFLYDDEDRNILYVLCEEDMNLSVARVSRVAEKIVVAENVVCGDVTFTQVKKVRPYAFFGVYLNEATLRGVGALASNAFSGASALTALHVECDFISDIQDDTFGPLFHNGMYIYDSINGFNLYKESKWVPADAVFTYIDNNGMEQSASPYLILSDDQKTFAVITYVDGSGISRTIDVYYGKVTTENVSDVQERVARAGYDIVGWQNERGEIVSGDKDYFVPYNQVLTCVWAPQKYKVYFVVSEGEVKKIVDGQNQSLAARRNETTGLITYVSEVTYENEYAFAFVGFDALKKVFLRWKDESENAYDTSGVWNTVLESREIYLYPVTEAKKYHIVYSVDNDVTVADSGKYVTYDASGWTLDVPVCAGYAFLGWYMEDENGNKIILTDGRGQSQLSWRYAADDEYTVYALWNSVLLYGAEVGVTYESVEYNKVFYLEVPENTSEKTFVGWYIIEDDGFETMITDSAGRSLAPWTREGKKQYHILAKWRQNE